MPRRYCNPILFHFEEMQFRVLSSPLTELFVLSRCQRFWANCSLWIPQKLETTQRRIETPSMRRPQTNCSFPSPSTCSPQQTDRNNSSDLCAFRRGYSGTEINIPCCNCSNWSTLEVEKLPETKDTFLLNISKTLSLLLQYKMSIKLLMAHKKPLMWVTRRILPPDLLH